MSPSLQVFLSGTLTFGVPLGFALRELALLRRWNGGGRRPPVPEVPPRALPPCLLAPLPPRPAAPTTARSRELETV